MVDQQSIDGGIAVRSVVVGRATGAALLYGVREAGRMRAITAFPLAVASESFCRSLEQQAPRLRYNAATSALAPRSELSASLRTQ
ncbi:hypothetical protein F1C58_09875 [Glaciihabitans sp. INWT7]|uniref:hypothetical protein n=1 Tax=Glaciihabitans sp. INWT7 TaxID=2596912 RepID=UPI001628D4DB|nr:hypothetical protein [Glaciihabitans sp. INWT7]QNE47176.1 hypothetical protein F1C58_09875 [Glaciihabitans sp. INWT7]